MIAEIQVKAVSAHEELGAATQALQGGDPNAAYDRLVGVTLDGQGKVEGVRDAAFAALQ